MSQRCKTQESTDDILKRIRSIILLHRPHLISRADLQIPELITEALVPNNTGNQITHNFNYKYDYNSNVPNAIPPNPFIQSTNNQRQQYYDNNQQQPGQQPVQMFTFNQTPIPTTNPTLYSTTNEQHQPQPRQEQQTCTTVMIQDEDSVALNESYQLTIRTASIQTYKQLINILVTVSKKYILSDVYINSLLRLNTFESLLSNDLRELLECIQRNTNWIITGLLNSSGICNLFSLVINAYCRLASTITGEAGFNLTSITSIAAMERRTIAIHTQLTSIMSSNQEVAMETDQIIHLNDQIEVLRSEIAERDSTVMRLNTRSTLQEQRIQSLESTNTILISSFKSLAKATNVTVTAALENPESIENLNRSIQSRLVERQNQLRAAETNMSDIKITNIQTINRLQKELQEARLNLEKATQELTSVSKELVETRSRQQQQLAINSEQKASISEITNLRTQLEDTRRTLISTQNDNQTNLTRISALEIELNVLREENKALLKNENRPVARTKPYNRRSSAAAGGDATLNFRALQRSLNDIEEINVRLSNENRTLQSENSRLKQDKYELATTSQSSCDRLQSDVENVRQKVQNLMQNQATLSLQDITTLNQKTTDYYNTKVSELTNENQSLREALENEITIQSDKLGDRLNTAEANLQNKIEKLALQIDPIAERTRVAENYVNSLKGDYEAFARSLANDRLDQ